MTEKLV